MRRLHGWLAMRVGWRADAIAGGLGALTALALPPLHLIPLLLLTFPGLLALIDAAPRPWLAMRRGWWFGIGLHLVGLYWITEAILFEAARFWWLVPLAVPALAAVLGVFIALAAVICWYARPGVPRVLVLAGSWTLLDLARQFVATGFPWNPLGSVWAMPHWPGDVMIQPAAWIGVHGLTLLTVLLAASMALGWRARVAAGALFAAWVAMGVVRAGSALPPGTGHMVVLVQGNVEQGRKWDRAVVLDVFERYLRLTREGVARAGGQPVIVVWPETATPFALQTDASARETIAAAAGDGVSLIGAVRFGQDGRPRNSLFALLRGGVTAAIYDKWHLVPFGEYQPDWLPIGVQVVPGGGFGAGEGARTLHVPGMPPAGPLICYEAIFPGQIVDFRDRPAWLVNVTNDAWFGNTNGPRQHLAAARMRAVEEGLPLMRAANTGISAAFDPLGHEIARLPLNVMGSLTVELPAALPPTLFSRFGLAVPASLAAGLFLSGVIRNSGRRRTSGG
ncbi:MAG: apolipoprotein N-acyltransferase [Acetobacteraceae bacterium]